jgi:4-amino-4-deoxy-L-arabinose transferase-like glycosyltransferase
MLLPVKLVNMLFSSYKRARFWWLSAIVAVLLFLRLGATPVYILDETKNAQCAREMLQRNDWVVPTFNEELRTDKPPLHYFFMMVSYRLFGISAFAARFFSAVMGLLTVWITFFYTKRHSGTDIALCTILVLAASTHFLFEFRLAVPDPYLIFFITLGLFSAYTWLQEDKVPQLYLAAASFGLATLTKGPVALAVPGLCLLVWVFWQKKWKIVWSRHLVPALLLMAIIILPWYILVHLATHGDWTRGFFIEHNYNRFVHSQEGHGGLFFIPVLFVLLGLLPFMSFIGEVIKYRQQVLASRFEQFSALVVVIFLIFFCISGTKLPNYPMPCYPFVAAVLGNFITLVLKKEIHSGRYPFYILLVFTLIIPVAGYFVIRQETETENIKWIALTLLIVPLVLVIPAGIRKKWDWNKNFFTIFVAYLVFNCIGLHWVYPYLYSQNPVTKTLAILNQQRPLIAYKSYNPAYNFYTPTVIRDCRSLDSLRHLLQKSPDALIVSRKEYLDSLQLLPLQVVAEHHDLFELPTTVLLMYKNGKHPIMALQDRKVAAPDRVTSGLPLASRIK